MHRVTHIVRTHTHIHTHRAYLLRSLYSSVDSFTTLGQYRVVRYIDNREKLIVETPMYRDHILAVHRERVKSRQ